MTWSPTAGKWQSHCSESSLPSTPHPSRLGAGASSQALPENGTYGLAKLGGPRPICPTCAVGVTHCLCRKLQLRSAPRHGSSAPARASDTAAGLALCLSSARHSSPLLRPPASPASTRCPEKTTSSTQSRLRDALESSLLMFEPHPATPTPGYVQPHLKISATGESLLLCIPPKSDVSSPTGLAPTLSC